MQNSIQKLCYIFVSFSLQKHTIFSLDYYIQSHTQWSKVGFPVIYNIGINQKQRYDNETTKKVMAAERVKDELIEHSNKEEYAIFHSSGDVELIDEKDFGGVGGTASRIRTAMKNVRRGGRT
jgi:hypothetical protein